MAKANGFYFKVTLPGLSPDTRPIFENYFVAGSDPQVAERDLRQKYEYVSEPIELIREGTVEATPPLNPGDVVREPATIP